MNTTNVFTLVFTQMCFTKCVYPAITVYLLDLACETTFILAHNITHSAFTVHYLQQPIKSNSCKYTSL